ncbi:DUF6531 domain-containing protein, partial [Chitinivorax sp. B]|uniref:DUF6531 domain-containing protein n=1 Tax=Chitinivorax sp. B TaxID=2502235 RepID=UPI0010F4391B
MVAITNGSQLGVLAGALEMSSGRVRFGQQQTGLSVNAATGNLVVQDRDDMLMGRGLGLGVLRTYNSQGRQDDDNHDNWRVGVYKQLRAESGVVGQVGSTLIRVREDGSEVRYRFDGANGGYRSDDEALEQGQIAVQGGEWVWTNHDGSVSERYDSLHQGRLLAITDRDGQSLRYHYADNGLLKRVELANGDTVHFDYDGLLLTQIRRQLADGGEQIRTRYGYDAQGRLSTLTLDLSPEDGKIDDGQVYQTHYRYEGDSLRLASLSQSDGTTVRFGYSELRPGDWRLTQVDEGAGRVTTFSYQDEQARDQYQTALVRTNELTGQGAAAVYRVRAGDTWATLGERLYGDAKAGDALRLALGAPDLQAGLDLTVPPSLLYRNQSGNGGQTTVTDPLGMSTSYHYDQAGRVTAISRNVSAPDGWWQHQEQVRYRYDEQGRLIGQTDAQGNSRQFRYDAAGNLVEERDASGLRLTRRYDTANRLLAETRYQYRAADGLNLAAVGQPAVHRYVYDAQGHLRFDLSAQGRVIEHRYNAL